MKNSNIHKVLICTITALLFCGFGWSVLYVRHFVNNAMEAQGHVVRLVRSDSKKGYVFKPVVAFQAIDGTNVEFTSSMGTSPPHYEVGESVVVYYDAKDPHSAMLNDWISLWGGPAILAVITAVFSFITYMIYFRVSLKSPRKRRKTIRPSGSGSG
ncbi:DUF3592 domain-containing protein [Phyllobacterium sp. YR531]|uniref:DUF3592 domain-containing protein n=1 Tax=Phyllobacterium sp. YR531 TaxID=1144343 RepID=UPI00026FAA3F|nr:DUF3592 domain-containing protein [Phyllobacterium sp. YR531]EJM99318.1 Protein of unknown function (DUF3592) [Phyllobacterium sp. YR531]